MIKVSYAAALIAGILSFFSPCFLPLIPAYFSYLAGTATEQDGKKISLKKNFLFVVGFSSVFTLLGAGAGTIGEYLRIYKSILTQIAGAVVILFGLYLLGLLPLSFLQKTYRLQIKARSVSLIGSFFLGIVFALGWTPCVGPILGSILTYAATQESALQGSLLLFVYSLGIGIPFLLAGLLFEKFLEFLKKARKYLRAVEIASGVFLVLFGLLLLTNSLPRISQFLLQLFQSF